MFLSQVGNHGGDHSVQSFVLNYFPQVKKLFPRGIETTKFISFGLENSIVDEHCSKVFRMTISRPYYCLEIIDMVISCLKLGASESQ